MRLFRPYGFPVGGDKSPVNYVILAMGELKEPYYRDAMAEYQKRMTTLGGLECVSLKTAVTPGRDLKSEEIRQALAREGEILLKTMAQARFARYMKIALCVEGRAMSSEELSGVLERASNDGKSGALFLIGSSWGLSEEVKAACDLRLSFSPMTFPHALFRVMLSEQIYRAASISAGSKYHK